MFLILFIFVFIFKNSWELGIGILVNYCNWEEIGKDYKYNWKIYKICYIFFKILLGKFVKKLKIEKKNILVYVF